VTRYRGKSTLPASSLDRRQFHHLGDVRREMVRLYWQAKEGRVDKGLVPALAKLLDMIGHYMVETEAEIRANQLVEQIEAARQDLIARGVAVPEMIDITPEKVVN
jgi:hypothetical protein